MIQPGPVDQTDLLAGYHRAASIKPVPKEDLNKVYSEYGLKGGQVKGQSDTQLQTRAAKAVVDWWKKQQSAAAPAKPAIKPAPPAKGTAKAPAAKPAGSTTVGTSAAAREGGGQATAAVRQGTANRAQAMQTFAGIREGTPVIKPKVPTPAEITRMLTAAGMGGTKPPAYAMASAEALTAWIARAKYNRNLLAAKSKTIAVKNAERAPAPKPKPIPHGALAANNL